MACATNIFHEPKPPLGLQPEFEHEHQANLDRVRQIMAAIERYCGASRPIPEEWFIELQRRVSPSDGNSSHFPCG